MNTKEIREAFLNYFQSKGHSIVSSSSLVPAGDPTLLFANSGMVQFKDVFLGTEPRPYTRATTCQKCLRISGKHNDLENVGRTARHHTLFEMLGNFSFGDYFKRDAITYAWEFVTSVLGLPKDRLWVTVFEQDDEAEELWTELTDVQPGRILRRGAKDNFWAMGETGPCGPCSEIFYYLGDNVAGQSDAEFLKDDGTYVEIWNLVFMQFNRDVQGMQHPLPKPSVDTGMGLERVAAIMQGKTANYDSDVLRKLIALTEKLSNRKYLGADYTERSTLRDEQYAADVAMRVIADHGRAAAFLLADGINPSSDGRGYVLRRLIRRACRHGRVLGFREPFLYRIAEEVIALMAESYPELAQHKDKVLKALRGEEEKFIANLDTGLALVQREVERLAQASTKVFPGTIAFQLHDTYGFPLDMTQDILQAHGMSVDTDGFSAEMEQQRERSRSARASETELILQRAVKPSSCVFRGYEFAEYESEVTGLFGPEGALAVARAGDDVALVAAESPFYAESGGQVGDTGRISAAGAALDVLDTQRVGNDTIVHVCRVVEGEITASDKIRLQIDELRRNRLRVHHSATHLLQTALREVLGPEVRQAGSRVSDRSLRFDFTHGEPVCEQQLFQIEDIVNELIRSNSEVVTRVVPLEEAKRSGATALFGEKYGERVRVVEIGPRSLELCGGTHANRAGDIGCFLIDFESSVSSGVRRIEAFAGSDALRQARSRSQLLGEIAHALRSTPRESVERVQKLVDRERELERELARVQQKVNSSKGSDLLERAVTREDGTRIVTGHFEEVSPGQLREVADDLRSKINHGAIALASITEGKAIFLVALTDDLVGRFHAGKLIKEVAEQAGSRGGGKADLAQAGGGDPSRISQALKRFEELIV